MLPGKLNLFHFGLASLISGFVQAAQLFSPASRPTRLFKKREPHNCIRLNKLLSAETYPPLQQVSSGRFLPVALVEFLFFGQARVQWVQYGAAFIYTDNI